MRFIGILLLAACAIQAGAAKVARGISETAAQQRLIVTFAPKTPAAEAVQLLHDVGVSVIENPDLLHTDWLVEGSPDAVALLAESDQVIKVFVASEEVAAAMPVRGCPSGHFEAPRIAEYRAAIGTGWDGAGTGPAELTWSAENIHPSMDPASVRATIARALAAWSRHAMIRFRYTTNTTAARNLDFAIATGAHGDGYPFDGRGRTLAHAFYPAGVTPEPLAGDVHLDADEGWSDGGSPDLYSALLHEIGHALGLSHSDQPGAVMYPYYRNLYELQADDISALQSVYGSGETFALHVDSIADVTTAASVELSGTVSGGSGEVSVTWSLGNTVGMAEGTRTWQIPYVPLELGENTIVVTVQDGAGASVSHAVSINRIEQSPAPPVVSPARPTEPPAPSTPPTPAQPPVDPPAQPPLVPNDTSVPVMTISSPAASSYSTSASELRIAGTARDNSGIEKVTWECGSQSGTASGTTSWKFTLPLLKGENNLIIRVHDRAGNVAWRTRMITRR